MLTIRKDQRPAFRAAMRKNFESDMVAQLREDFPEDCEVLGEDQVRRVIDLGVDRAAAHGFETRGDVCDYIVMMFIIGSYFDEDPQLPWAAEVLRDEGEAGPSATMEALYARANEYLGRVAGEDGEYYRKALLRARRMTFESLARPGSGNMSHEIRPFLRRLYPEKHGELADSSLRRMGNLGQASATRYGIGTPEGTLVYVALMFMLGSHFDRDPQHPWAGEVLQDRATTSADLKARRLQEAAMARLAQSRAIDTSAEEA